MKLDLGTWLGLAAALGFILLGNALEGGHMAAIVQPTAALIVFGGTLGAVLVSFPLSAVLDAVRALARVLGDQPLPGPAVLDDVQRFSQLARKDGLVALEEASRQARHPFLESSLLKVADGVDSKTLSEMLDAQIEQFERQGEVPAKVFEAGGGYAPTIGIIGAVLGLIHVMANLSDVAKVGAGIAVAFVATIYGVGLANVVLLPAANKLKIKHHEDVQLREMIKQGVLGIQEGINPRLLADRLRPFLHGDTGGHARPHATGAPKDAGRAAA